MVRRRNAHIHCRVEVSRWTLWANGMSADGGGAIVRILCWMDCDNGGCVGGMRDCELRKLCLLSSIVRESWQVGGCGDGKVESSGRCVTRRSDRGVTSVWRSAKLLAACITDTYAVLL